MITLFIAFVLPACLTSKAKGYSITESKAYEASPTCPRRPKVREGEFKFKTECEIYSQIANGGNGMTPFRGQLTDNELHMMAAFVHDQLRKAKN